MSQKGVGSPKIRFVYENGREKNDLHKVFGEWFMIQCRGRVRPCGGWALPVHLLLGDRGRGPLQSMRGHRTSSGWQKVSQREGKGAILEGSIPQSSNSHVVMTPHDMRRREIPTSRAETIQPFQDQAVINFYCLKPQFDYALQCQWLEPLRRPQNSQPGKSWEWCKPLQ